MSETPTRPRVRRGLWIAGLVLAVAAFGVLVHFASSGAVAGFPIEMISKGRSWIFLGGYLAVGYVGLLLLGLARPRMKAGEAGPVEAVESTRVVSKNVDEGPAPLAAGEATQDGTTSSSDEVPPKPLAEADSPSSNSDEEADDEV